MSLRELLGYNLKSVRAYLLKEFPMYAGSGLWRNGHLPRRSALGFDRELTLTARSGRSALERIASSVTGLCV
jgi:hypothetical protein